MCSWDFSLDNLIDKLPLFLRQTLFLGSPILLTASTEHHTHPRGPYLLWRADQLQFNPNRDIETDAESEKASVTQNLKCKYIDSWFPRGNQSKEIGKFKQCGVKRTSDLVCVQSHICLLLKVRNLRHSLSDLKIFSAHRQKRWRWRDLLSQTWPFIIPDTCGEWKHSLV